LQIGLWYTVTDAVGCETLGSETHAAMDTLWHIRLLGTLEARQGTAAISRFATSRVAALLARLALLPQRTHSREELAGLLWPDADAEAGRLNLRVALASLRRQMEPPGGSPGSIFITDRTSIRLHPRICTSDAAEFEKALREASRSADPAHKREKLEQALAFYEGELLPGFYDEWILDERERLQALCDEAQIQCRALSPAPLPPQPLPSAPVGLPQSALLNFPGQFTRFFARSAEQAQLVRLLADPEIRLVTLLGPGGSGKTRLATETARQAAASFDGLVCFVPLADISDGALVASTAASALRLPLSGDKSPLDQIAAHLTAFSSARSLLVLDNLEHLGTEGAAEVQALLEAAPRLTCLATSRQKLHLAGEHEVPLAPLPVPANDAPELPAQLASYSGVQLFVDRARSVRSDFQITPQNADADAAVCRSLEGLPLALELAAARIQALSPRQMQQQLAARLDFLTSRRRDLPPRHQSLRAALEWSAHLLSPDQTRFFVQLSVFRGGWSLEAAAAVCEVSHPLLLLEQLCERSLIFAAETPALESPDAAGAATAVWIRGEMRFRMLESLREFGEEQLTLPERQALARRHAGYFQRLAAEMGRLWYGPQQILGLETLTSEYDNLRAALSFCRSDTPDTDWNGTQTGLRLAAALGDYWTTRGMMREGMDWLDGALLGGGDLDVRAAALAQAGWLAAGVSDFARASTALTESITLNRRLGDDAALTLALRLRGTAFIWKGEFENAETDLEEALALSRARSDDYALGIVLNSLGVLANEWKSDNVRAKERYDEALPLLLKVGDRQRASYCLHNLGNIAHDDGESTRAVAQLRHSLALASELGDEWHRTYCLRSLGAVFLGLGELENTSGLLEEGLALCRRLRDRMTEAGTLLILACVRRRQGRFADAAAEAQAALRLYAAIDRPEGVMRSWLNLADTAAAGSDWETAACLLSAADAALPTFPTDDDRDRAAALCHSARAALSPAAFSAAWTRGRTLTCDDYGLH